MTLDPLQPAGLGFLLLLAHAAWSDVRRRRIPNATVAGLLVLWLGAAFLGASFSWLDPGGALLLLLAGTLLWRRDLLGGGDVKLLAVVGLWLGGSGLLPLLLGSCLAAGVVALAQLALPRLTLVLSHTPLRHGLALLPSEPPVSLPFGLAVGVAAAALWLAPAL
ncbi:prepilin peptidase [Marinimicrococcus flavescens]|uniref:Prepilin peptidase n=1 Tax=Marinimicrococcus flavescens TaxID=3031815 RepID=A0AAP4D4X8_9PROT|nr:prepilin peptidase [Marinimicrococcus flavescens]